MMGLRPNHTGEGIMEKIVLPEKSKVQPLDYSKVENWVINANADLNTDFDLIFFCGTSIINTDRDNGVGCMVTDESRAMGYGNYLVVGKQLSDNARVFCPMQRQMSMKYALDAYKTHDAMFADLGTKEPYIDLEAALDYYFEHYNRDAKRPFVLAGHSQGAGALQVCLMRYFLTTDKKDYLKNMIAAYSIGYGVSKKHFDAMPNKEGRLHFAEGAGDFNCLIPWNTEGPGEKGTSILLADEGDETLVINPLNWKRDETYAGIEENCGVLVKEQRKDGTIRYYLSLLDKDLCDAQLDLKRGSVICSTRSTEYLNLPFYKGELWGGKSLHGIDGSAFYANMGRNLKLRVANFLAAKNASN